MTTVEQTIYDLAEHIIALTTDQSRDVVPIMFDIQKAAKNIKQAIEKE